MVSAGQTAAQAGLIAGMIMVIAVFLMNVFVVGAELYYQVVIVYRHQLKSRTKKEEKKPPAPLRQGWTFDTNKLSADPLGSKLAPPPKSILVKKDLDKKRKDQDKPKPPRKKLSFKEINNPAIITESQRKKWAKRIPQSTPRKKQSAEVLKPHLNKAEVPLIQASKEEIK